MKKQIFNFNLIFVIILITVLFSCSIYIPSHFDFRPSYYHIILDIIPDDSSVFLNGKFIGLAYEFSTNKTPLKLRSLENELFFKKKGYLEKAVILDDIYDGNSSKIIVSEKLIQDKTYSKSQPPTNQPTKKPLEYNGKEVKIKDDLTAKPAIEQEKFKTILIELTFSDPEASIFIDGKFIGISPENKIINNLRLTKTKHTLQVFKPGHKIFSQTIDLSDKDSFKLKITLIKE